jgi:predicted dehydrogenase
MAAECVRKEVPVLIEKPLSTGLKGVAELRSATLRRKVAVSVAYVHRANPIFSAFREAVQSGRFGIPVEVVATAGQHFPHYRPAYREIYYRDRSTGGGAVQDALTHLANALEWVVGPVRELVADLDHQVLEGVEVEDTVHVLTRHARGVMGSLQLNQHQAPNEFILTVHCTKGSVRLELHENRWRWMEHPQTPWNDALGVPLERDDLFIRQAHAFLDTCETGRAPLCSLEEGEQSLRFNLGVLESAQKRAWVTLT